MKELESIVGSELSRGKVVVHLAYQYGVRSTGGAAIASTRLHKALLANGFNSHYVCLRICEQGKNVYSLFDTLPLAFRLLFRIPKMYGLWNKLRLPFPGFRKLIDGIKPDIIHVHWLNLGGPSYEQLKRLPYPMVFNLHDLFMILPGGGVSR